MANLLVKAVLTEIEGTGNHEVDISITGKLENGPIEITKIMVDNLSEYAYLYHIHEFLLPEEYLRKELNIRVDKWFEVK